MQAAQSQRRLLTVGCRRNSFLEEFCTDLTQLAGQGFASFITGLSEFVHRLMALFSDCVTAIAHRFCGNFFGFVFCRTNGVIGVSFGVPLSLVNRLIEIALCFTLQRFRNFFGLGPSLTREFGGPSLGLVHDGFRPVVRFLGNLFRSTFSFSHNLLSFSFPCHRYSRSFSLFVAIASQYLCRIQMKYFLRMTSR